MTDFARRRFLLGTSTAASAALLTGCAGLQRTAVAPGKLGSEEWRWLGSEERLFATQRSEFDIVVKQGPESRVLRLRTREVPAGLDLEHIAVRMKATMLQASGVGIAGPQVGLNLRIAWLKLDYKEKEPYLVFWRNPTILERSDETLDAYEGCLSVPDKGGLVRRSQWVKAQFLNADGAVATLEAEGYNAVLIQHEIDHLEGILYTDRLRGELLSRAEMLEKRKQIEPQQPGPEPPPPKASTGSDELRSLHLEGAAFFWA